jgi:hypothetical protein
METLRSPETSVHFYQTIVRHIQEDFILLNLRFFNDSDSARGIISVA